MKCDKNATAIYITPDVRVLEEKQFQGFAKLRKVMFTGDVIGARAFANCTELEKVDLGLLHKIERIGKGAFAGCKKLETIMTCAGVQVVEANAFEGCARLTEIDLLGAEQIGDGAFMGCEKLTEIRMGCSLKKIGARAFAGCDSLAPFDLPDGVVSIGDRAFEGCRSLDCIYIPASVTHIGEKAFAYHRNFVICCDEGSYAERYAKENGITCRFSKSVFEGCVARNVDPVTPESRDQQDTQHHVLRIKEKALFIKSNEYKGNMAMEVIVPKNTVYIGQGAFAQCRFLESVVIEDGMFKIDEKAFEGCINLKRIHIPHTVISIADNAFLGCKEDLIIVCVKDSTAEKYAKRHGYAIRYAF